MQVTKLIFVKTNRARERGKIYLQFLILFLRITNAKRPISMFSKIVLRGWQKYYS